MQPVFDFGSPAEVLKGTKGTEGTEGTRPAPGAVYVIGACRMTPLSAITPAIGATVMKNGRGPGIVYDRGPYGAEVAMLDGSGIAHHVTIGAAWTVIDGQELDADDLQQLVNRCRIADLDARHAEEDKRKRDNEAHAVACEQARAAFPYLTPLEDSSKSRHATAAANIRTELARAFPGIKFRVTSESYSGGSSIDVQWTDGPTRDQVQEVTRKYCAGYFDGLDDSYHYTRAPHGDAFGSVRHVMEDRKATLDGVRRAWTASGGSVQDVKTPANNGPVFDAADYGLERCIWRQWEACDLRTPDQIAAADRIAKGGTEKRGKADRTGARPATASGQINFHRGSVELWFTARPDRTVLDKLKSAGFRWNRADKMWYKADSPGARLVMEEICRTDTGEQTRTTE